MEEVINNIIENSKKAYKQSVIIEDESLQDTLLEILTDIKKLETMLNSNTEDVIKSIITSKKNRYTYEQVKAIAKIQLLLAREEISFELASKKILEIASHFPIRNLVQYNKRMQGYLKGIGSYGFAIPANWAKALLELTNNDAMIVKALKNQQKAYMEKNGKANQTLEKLLNGL